MSLIKKGLLIGNERDSKDLRSLTRQGVTHILCAAEELYPAHPGKFAYRHVMASDVPEYNLSRHFDQASDFILEAISNGGTVLVHCAAGISRSVTLSIAYLMKHENMKLSSAYGLIKSRRAIANPNPGFIKQLKDFEQRLEQFRPRLSHYSSSDRNFETSPSKYTPGSMSRRFPLRFSESNKPKEIRGDPYLNIRKDFEESKISLQTQQKLYPGKEHMGGSSINRMSNSSIADRHLSSHPLTSKSIYFGDRISQGEIRPSYYREHQGPILAQPLIHHYVDRSLRSNDSYAKYLQRSYTSRDGPVRAVNYRPVREDYMGSSDHRQVSNYLSERPLATIHSSRLDFKPRLSFHY